MEQWSRWKLLVAFWTGQWAISLFAWPLLFWGDLDPLLLAITAVGLATITLLQGVLILPLRPLSPSVPRRTGRVLRCGLGGLGAGTMAGWTLSVILWTEMPFGLVYRRLAPAIAPITTLIPDWLYPFTALIAALALVSPPAALILWFRTRDGTSARLSTCIAALVAGLLITAIAGGVVAIMMLIAPADLYTYRWYPLVLVAVMLLSWTITTPLIATYTRQWHGPALFDRLARRLFAGTLLATAALLPLDIMIRRRTDCYCAEPTFWSLTLCWAAGLIVLGPMVFLLPARRQQLRLMRLACIHCGYDMRATAALKLCPECGKAWKGTDVHQGYRKVDSESTGWRTESGS
jgi:hypothetical protein